MTFELFRQTCDVPREPDNWIETLKDHGLIRFSDWETTAQRYIPHPEVTEAVNVAIRLGKSLLVTGEPGVGKSQLASAVAWQLGLDQPLKFVAKSGSESQDLFYRYDALKRFHAIEAARHVATMLKQTNRKETSKDTLTLSLPDDPRNFIEYTALGDAILKAHNPTEVAALLTPNFKSPPKPAKSVVLIDEIDKASSDFCNDLLEEIESLQFRVPEIREARTSPLPPELRPIVIIASNRERELPQAFLRRCVYVDIPFPVSDGSVQSGSDTAYTIENILSRRIEASKAWAPLTNSVIVLIEKLRQRGRMNKPPGTAELIDAIELLDSTKADFGQTLVNQPELINRVIRTLVKTPEDLRAARELPELRDTIQQTENVARSV